MAYVRYDFRVFVLMVLLLLVGGVKIPAAQAQESVASGALSQTQQRDLLNKLTNLIERRARDQLIAEVEGFLSKRMDPGSYGVEVSVTPNAATLRKLLAGVGPVNTTIFLQGFSLKAYAEMRAFFSEATVEIGFSDRMNRNEWLPHFKAVESFVATGKSPPEVFRSKAIKMPLTPQERAIRLQFEESRRELASDRKAREEIETRMKRLESELRRQDSKYAAEQRSKELEEENKVLEERLIEERKKMEELAQQIEEKPLFERISRQMPLIIRTSAANVLLGTLVFLAAFVLAWFVFLSARTISRQLRVAVDTLADSLGNRSDRKGKGDQTELILKQESDDRQQGGSAGGGDFDLDILRALNTAIEELRLLVNGDMRTSISILGNYIENKQYHRAFIVMDLLGADLAGQMIRGLSPSLVRNLKRYFFSHVSSRPSMEEKLLEANEMRSKLNATSVLMQQNSERMLTTVLLSATDDELCSALTTISPDKAVSVLCMLPPDRMVRIMHKAPKEVGSQWRRALGQVLNTGVAVDESTVAAISAIVSNPENGQFEENKEYLRKVFAMADEHEVADLLAGLEETPRLALEVSGFRATTEDLWAQPIAILNKLFMGFDLETIGGLLFEAPEHLRHAYLAKANTRRRDVIEETLANFASNPQQKAKLAVVISEARRQVLTDLSELAQAGIAELPSYVRLRERLSQSVGTGSLTPQSVVSDSTSEAGEESEERDEEAKTEAA